MQSSTKVTAEATEVHLNVVQIGRHWVRISVMNAGTAALALLVALHLLRLTGYDAFLLRMLAAVRHLLRYSVRWG